MLVLSRKVEERILIGDNIVVTIVEVKGDKVRVGVEAPADVVILREELSGRGEVESSSRVASSPVKTSGGGMRDRVQSRRNPANR